jgi:hypothetical protein
MIRRLQTFALTACLLAAGCHSAATTKTAEPAAAQPVTASPLHTDPATISDPCAEHMQDLCEAMLLSYTLNKHLPASLPELQPYAETGTTLTFNCPVSGDPYTYAPAGLTSPGIHDRLVLYDAKPVHNGHRWGIVMAPAEGRNPVTLYVIPLKDSLLNAYLQK